MSLVLQSSGGGSVTVQEPVTASNFTQTLPAATGEIVVTGANSSIVSGTAVASTSGTSIDFTGIPSWVKRITVMFNGVSTNGTSAPIIQLGDSSGIENTGYNDTCGNIATTTPTVTSTGGTGFVVANYGAGSDAASGAVVLNLVSGNIWVLSGVVRLTSVRISYCAGQKSLSDTLTQLRITTFNGTDTFDSGSINILYE
jgi:hypothetical protein